MDLSIIVPVYNVEDYIRPCIKSIFRQGLDDNCFEVIIVNDGTEDRSIEVIQDIVKQHQNITILNQENQGLSVARNNGIAMAKGEYILMPDSDDLIIENRLKPLLEKAIETKVDLVIADFISLKDEEIKEMHQHIPKQPTPVYVEKTGEQIFLGILNPYYCYVWRTLYRREFINKHHLSFFPGIRYQDIPFTHECYLKANRCLRTNMILNIYRRWSGSSTNAYKKDNTKDFIIALNETWKLRQIKGLSPKILHKLEKDVYISFRTMLFHVLHTTKKTIDRNEIIDYLNQNAPDIKFYHNIRQRYMTRMIRRMPHLFINLYYYYSKIVHK